MKRGFLSQLTPLRNRIKGMIGGIGMFLPLDQLCTDVWGCVTDIDTQPQLRLRLQEFGLVPGTRVRRRYSSPAGDVMAIELRGSVLALRTRDMRSIWVRV